MKSLTLILTTILLTACGYDYSEVQSAKAACTAANGEFSTGSHTGTAIHRTYCKVDGVKYRIGRTTQTFFDGVQQ